MYYSPKKQTSHSFQRHTRGSNGKIPAFLSIIALILFGGLFLIQTNALKIKHIIIEGNDPALTKGLKMYIASHIPYLFSSLKNAHQELLAAHPQLQTLSFRLDLPKRTVVASYTPRIGHFLWCKTQLADTANEDANCYLVDKDGVIFERSGVIQSTLLTRVDDFYFDVTKTGMRIPSLYITSLISIENGLKQKNISTDYIRIETPFSVKAIINGRTELRFTALEQIDIQLKTLGVFLDSLTPEKLSALSYIDLRIKNRIYYKN